LDINLIQTSNLKPQTSNLKPQTSNLKPQTSNLIKPQTSISQCFALIVCVLFSLTVKAQERIQVYNWYDYIDLSILADFKKETGIEVDYKTFSSEREVRNLLKQQKTIDVAIVPHFALPSLISEQRLHKLDKARLPTRHNIDSFIQTRVNLVAEGAEDYALPYLWYTAALGFNKKTLGNVLGEDLAKDWSLLFDAGKASKAKTCGVALADAPTELYAVLLSYSGYPALLEKTPLNRLRRLSRRTLLPLRDNLRYIDSDRYLYDLGKGDLCLAMGWSGGILRAARMNPDVEVVFPKQSALTMAFDLMVITQTAQNPAAAHRFIDFLSRPEISARNVEKTLYGSPLKNIGAYLEPSLQNNPLLQLSEKNKTRMHLLSVPGSEQQAVIDGLWDGFVQAN